MSALDNLLANKDKIAYTSYFAADKIAVYSTTEEGSGDGVGRRTSIVATAPSILPNVQLTYGSITNPYGTKLLPTGSWSLDEINWYPFNVPVFYFNVVQQAYLWQAMAWMACSNSTIYFMANSQFTSSQTVYYQYALDSLT